LATRLGRTVARAVASYRGEPAEVRARFEAGLAAARDSLVHSEEISKPTRQVLIDAVVMIFVEAYVGSSWGKVHAALAESVPELYAQVKDLLPSGTGDSPLAL
jgi:microcompartment protein CcmL/EutN